MEEENGDEHDVAREMRNSVSYIQTIPHTAPPNISICMRLYMRGEIKARQNPP